MPLLPSCLDVQLIHLPPRRACSRTVPDVTGLPFFEFQYLAVTRTVAPEAMFRLLTVVRIVGLTFAAAAAVTGVVAALAGCVAMSWPAQRHRPRDSARVPVPTDVRRRRLE